MTADTEQERWLPIAGFEGYYEVSDMGRVRSLDRTITTAEGVVRRLRGQLISTPAGNGRRKKYLIARMCRATTDDDRTARVHRLVLETFVGPCPPGMEACHGARGHLCNELSNLSWDTHVKNSADQVRDGTHHKGTQHGNAKLTEATIPAIRADPRPNAEIGREHGVHKATICDVKARRTWKHVPE